MKTLRLLFAAILLLQVFFSSAQQIIYSKAQVQINDASSFRKLLSLGIDLEGSQRSENKLIGIFSEYDLNKIKNAGFDVDIIIPDLTRYYVERNKQASQKSRSSCEPSSDAVVIHTPVHFELGSVGGFYSLTELYAELDSMAMLYPNLVKAKQPASTTTTIEGRTVYYVKISDNPNIDENEPEVLYTALTHAREPAGMQQLVFYMWYLLENYSTNPEIKYLVDNTELFFIPCVNPDGYQYNISNNPQGGGMHRKNMRQTGASNPGIDLNRNFGYQWGYDNVGSSDDPNTDTYRGTAAFSEPETQILKSFCESRNFATGLNFHCYSNLLVMPYGYAENTFPADSLLYFEYAKLLTSENHFPYGTPNQTVGYTANGGADDWMYGEQLSKPKIISYTPEAGEPSDGFWPQINRIEDICKSNIRMDMYIALVNLAYAQLSGLSRELISTQNFFVNFNLKRYGAQPATYTVSVQPLSANIQSVGAAKVFSNLQQFASVSDSIQITLSPTIQQGESVEYVVIKNNGTYSTYDTIRRIYGSPNVLFTHNCNAMSGWSSTSWNITNSQYVSPSSSITDSPSGNYSTYANKSITLSSSVNLQNVAWAELRFWAKWDIEEGYDYVQLLASVDGGATWTALCGNYTNTGTVYQVAGLPVYDGQQNTWVQERVSLEDYIGKTVKFRFTLRSDGYDNRDGFYFDDFEILTMDSLFSNIDNNSFNTGFYLYPNPAKNNVMVNLPSERNGHSCSLILTDLQGRMLKNIDLPDNAQTYELNVEDLKSGIYILNYQSPNNISKPLRLEILK